MNGTRSGRPLARRGEAGYSVIELSVVAAVMMTVLVLALGALDSLTKTETRVQGLVTNQETVRFGLDRVQRDLRAANPVDAVAVTGSYSNAIQVELGPNPGTRSYIRWFYDTTPASPTYEDLLRQAMSGPANATILSQVIAISRVRNVETGIPVFSYFDAHGGDLVANNPNTPANVANCAIRVHVQVNSDAQPGPQPFSENIDVELRNRLPGGIIGC